MMKYVLKGFMDCVEVLKGPDFRFRFSGLQINKGDLNKTEDFRLEDDHEEHEHFYMRHYHLIDPNAVDFLKNLRYNLFIKNVNETIPMNFAKFTGVRSISVYGLVKDENHFLSFLKSLTLLRSLSLNNSDLSQQFFDLSEQCFDQLSTSARSLTHLKLLGETPLNFDFIGKLSHLYDLFIFRPVLSIALITSLARGLTELSNLEVCEFKYKLRDTNRLDLFFIKKCRVSNVWNVKKLNSEPTIVFKTKNPEKIVNFLETPRIPKPRWRL